MNNDDDDDDDDCRSYLTLLFTHARSLDGGERTAGLYAK